MFATTSPQLPIPYSKLGSTKLHLFQSFNVKHLKMKPTVVAQDEMFPDGDAGWMEMDEAASGGGMMIELAANERAVHGDFFNNFDDLFDDDDLQ